MWRSRGWPTDHGRRSSELGDVEYHETAPEMLPESSDVEKLALELELPRTAGHAVTCGEAEQLRSRTHHYQALVWRIGVSMQWDDSQHSRSHK